MIFYEILRKEKFDLPNFWDRNPSPFPPFYDAHFFPTCIPPPHTNKNLRPVFRVSTKDNFLGSVGVLSSTEKAHGSVWAWDGELTPSVPDRTSLTELRRPPIMARLLLPSLGRPPFSLSACKNPLEWMRCS